MKIDLVTVSLMMGLAVACRGEGPNQNQHEERAGKTQNSTIRWQFDTHG